MGCWIPLIVNTQKQNNGQHSHQTLYSCQMDTQQNPLIARTHAEEECLAQSVPVARINSLECCCCCFFSFVNPDLSQWWTELKWLPVWALTYCPRWYTCCSMSCTPSPIRRGRQSSHSPLLLPSLLDWWSWYKASGCWTIMITRYTHTLTWLTLHSPKFAYIVVVQGKTVLMYFKGGGTSVFVCYQHLHSFSFVLTRVHSSSSCTRLPLSVSLSGNMSESCKHWCARANTLWRYDTSTSQSPRLPPPPRPSSACLYCSTTGENRERTRWICSLCKNTSKQNRNVVFDSNGKVLHSEAWTRKIAFLF